MPHNNNNNNNNNMAHLRIIHHQKMRGSDRKFFNLVPARKYFFFTKKTFTGGEMKIRPTYAQRLFEASLKDLLTKDDCRRR